MSIETKQEDRREEINAETVAHFCRNVDAFLTRKDEWDKVTRSRDQVLALEDDIDLPMKKTIAMLALLDIEPMFSCCGFNYFDQPAHKTHIYGYWQVMMKPTLRALSLTTFVVGAMKDYNFRPYIELKMQGAVLTWLRGLYSAIESWNSPTSPHQAEMGVQFISALEPILLSQQESMKDVAVIEDSNEFMLAFSPYWQYPSKLPWTVTKQQLLDGAYTYNRLESK